MKLIIWWLALMIILPLTFLFWWKKSWRLLIGVIIGVILLISCFLPDEITYSIIKKELEEAAEKPQQKLITALKNISDTTPNPSDTEKLKLEKAIKTRREELEKYRKEIFQKNQPTEVEKMLLSGYSKILFSHESRWIKEYGREGNPRPFLFCGEEFNKGLSRENWHLDHRTIDFSASENSNLESLNQKLQQIHQAGEIEIEYPPYCYLVWLKNIDKITNLEVKNELLKIVDFTKNSNLGEYEKETKNGSETVRTKKTIDFSRFMLVVTTSSWSPQLARELSQKMKHIELFFDKYFLVIFLVSSGLEIVIFYLLIRGQKRAKKTK